MRLIIAGGRDFADHELFHSAIAAFIAQHGKPSLIISGCRMGEEWARAEGLILMKRPAERLPKRVAEGALTRRQKMQGYHTWNYYKRAGGDGRLGGGGGHFFSWGCYHADSLCLWSAGRGSVTATVTGALPENRSSRSSEATSSSGGGERDCTDSQGSTGSLLGVCCRITTSAISAR